ncbi:MAG: hypothetical protein ACK5Y2_02245 [Bdellovibrionales bacterium]
MRASIYVVFSALFIFLTAQSAGRPSVPRLTKIGVNKRPVIAQSKPEFYQKRGRVNVIRRYFIAKWGTQTFEYGIAEYHCDSRKCEQLPDTLFLATYEDCRGLKKNGKPDCRGLKSVRVDQWSSSDELDGPTGRQWYSCEEYHRPCDGRVSDLEEYPERYSPENPENPSGF